MDLERSVLGEFIECYKRHYTLWDTSAPDYMNREMKVIGHKELLTILRKLKRDAQIEDVKKKINTLRSSYRKEFKKVKRSLGQSEYIYQPSVWWYDLMDFLQNLEKPFESIYIPMDMNSSDSTQVEKHEYHEKYSSPSPPPPPARLKKRKPTIQKATAGCDELLEIMCQQLKQSNDEADVLGKGWAFQYRDLETEQKIYAKKAIDDILFEAKLGKLHRHSVKVNEDTCTNFAIEFKNDS